MTKLRKKTPEMAHFYKSYLFEHFWATSKFVDDIGPVFWHPHLIKPNFFNLDNSSESNDELNMGGSPGLVGMGDDSCLQGRGFESWHRILDGHFFTLICKNCINVCLKRPKINEKEAGAGPFKKRFIEHSSVVSSAPTILRPRVQILSTPSRYAFFN